MLRELRGRLGAGEMHEAKLSDDRLLVFLCHSSGDKKSVRDLNAKLKSDGFRPWLDEEELLPGHDWNEEIQSAVRASHVFVVCLSASSITKAGFVQKEIKLALDVADEKPPGSIFLIPARFEDCDIPKRLSHLQWVDLFAAGGYERLVASLRTCELQRARSQYSPQIERKMARNTKASAVPPVSTALLEVPKKPSLKRSDFTTVGLGSLPPGQLNIDAPVGVAFFICNSEQRFETSAQNLKASLRIRSVDGKEANIESAPWFKNTASAAHGHYFYPTITLGMLEAAGVVCAVMRDSRFYTALYANDTTVSEGEPISYGEWDLDLKIEGDDIMREFKGTLRFLPNGSSSLLPIE